MSPTSQSNVAQAAPIAPYLGIQIRLRDIFKTVAPTKFKALIFSRPEAISKFDNKKFIKNRRIAQERTSNISAEGRNLFPYIVLTTSWEKLQSTNAILHPIKEYMASAFLNLPLNLD